MKKIIEVLKKENGINDYKVISDLKETYELFFVKKNLETIRSTKTIDTKVTIYVDHDGFRGDSTFTVYDYLSKNEIKSLIKKAILKAKLINNEFYELPSSNENKEEIDSNLSKGSLQSQAVKIAKAVFKAKTGTKGSLNATEIFVTKKTTHIVNSKGIDKQNTVYSAMVETIPTYTTEKISVELYEDYCFAEFDAKKITEEMACALKDAKARSSAKKISRFKPCNVILRNKDASELYRNISSELAYPSVYSDSNFYNEGDMIQKNVQGDYLNITLTNEVKGSIYNASFDRDGETLTPVTIVKEGKAVSYHGSSRFAYYLKKPSTGLLPNIEVSCGKTDAQELKKDPYLEVVSMSGIQVDLYNDYIGGEVRLAYYFDGSKVRPVTGLSIYGKVSEVVSSIKLSKEQDVRDGVCGPKIICSDKFSLV